MSLKFIPFVAEKLLIYFPPRIKYCNFIRIQPLSQTIAINCGVCAHCSRNGRVRKIWWPIKRGKVVLRSNSNIRFMFWIWRWFFSFLQFIRDLRKCIWWIENDLKKTVSNVRMQHVTSNLFSTLSQQTPTQHIRFRIENKSQHLKIEWLLWLHTHSIVLHNRTWNVCTYFPLFCFGCFFFVVRSTAQVSKIILCQERERVNMYLLVSMSTFCYCVNLNTLETHCNICLV